MLILDGRRKPGKGVDRPKHRDYQHRDVVDKLGIKPGHAVAFAEEAGVTGDREWEIDAALCQRILLRTGRPPATEDETVDVVLVWVDAMTDVAEILKRWRLHLKPDGGIWLLTPKRGLAGYVDQSIIIAVGVQTGLVDNKVCSISPTTSAIRFVIRKIDR
jgi:Protein of unknown function (DUF3052)